MPVVGRSNLETMMLAENKKKIFEEIEASMRYYVKINRRQKAHIYALLSQGCTYFYKRKASPILNKKSMFGDKKLIVNPKFKLIAQYTGK